MFDEDDLLPISALQHLVFCARQCALIHIEGVWEENRLTAEGRHLHDRADSPDTETRGGLRVVRGLRLRSLRLGLSGKADVVEFHRLPAGTDEGLVFNGADDRWRPFPVEYKRGRPKPDLCDKVQLCAQAICIEEMTGASVPEGALFYGAVRRREDVVFGDALRLRTEATCAGLHRLVRVGETPAAKYEKKCESCSLLNLCMPKAGGRRGKVESYLSAAIRGTAQEEDR
jgi:CRISPR-associated exonuclease Cas4